jgi:hypothetical protein
MDLREVSWAEGTYNSNFEETQEGVLSPKVVR